MNFVLVHPPGGGKPYRAPLDGALLSPEAPPPPATVDEAAPLTAWAEPKAPEPAVLEGTLPEKVYALVFLDCDGCLALEVYETPEGQAEGFREFLELFRMAFDPPDIGPDALQERFEEHQYECCCRVADIEAPFGGLWQQERKLRLKKHFEREIEKMNRKTP